jgi:Fe-S-cluster containining protein
MKRVDLDGIDRLPGRRVAAGETFRFRCHPGVDCFNRCCRNLNLFLYPYDVLRLKTRLGIGSDEFLDRHVDAVLRPGNHFPDVLLRMSESVERTCPFLSPEGCTVYVDRPDTCRTFPLEQALEHDPAAGRDEALFFFRPPEFCRGVEEEASWTVPEWTTDQEAGDYHRMTVKWAEVRRLFESDPWGAEGPEGRRARMAFMAAYNIDRFREFVFESSFLKRFKVKPDLLRRLRRDEAELLLLGYDWIKLFVWGMPSKRIKPRG